MTIEEMRVMLREWVSELSLICGAVLTVVVCYFHYIAVIPVICFAIYWLTKEDK